MSRAGTLLAGVWAAALSCQPGAARDAANKIETFFRVVPPVLETAYREALATCVRANVRDPASPLPAELEAADACTRDVTRIWTPIWDAFALVDQGCDVAPSLCKEPSP